jgi:hypothetical protein
MFEIEDALQDIGIPVMHDDQRGAAIVVLAALINACRITGKHFQDLRVVISGAGAACYTIATTDKMYRLYPSVLHPGQGYYCLRYPGDHLSGKGRIVREQVQVYSWR